MGIKGNSRAGMSWSNMRKILERENICDGLKGRIQYFQTRYRGAHDQSGRIAIRFDGQEIFQADYLTCMQKQYDLSKALRLENGQIDWQKVGNELQNQSYEYSFYQSFYTYHNANIEESLESPDPMVRLFGILDRRVGKRRLEKLAFEVNQQPAWLQVFYRLRLGVVVKAQFDKFYEQHFGEYELLYRVFYEFPVGIRFETGIGDDSQTWENNARQRSKTIFNELFLADDRIYILVNDFDDDLDDLAKGVMKTVRSFLNDVDNEHSYPFTSQINPEFKCRRYLFKIQVKDIESQGLIDEIINADLYGSSWINGAVYFINPRNHVILRLYSSEGLDVITDDKDYLKWVYEKYNDWVLDYDRERIDEVFLSE